MAVTDHEIPPRLRSLKPRDARFLGVMLGLGYSEPANGQSIQNHINSSNNPQQAAKDLLNKLETKLLPEQEIAWIDKSNHRILINSFMYLYELLLSLPDPNNHPSFAYLNNPPYETRYENIILALDCWPATLQEKRDMIANIKEQYTQKIAPKKWINWLKPDQDQQISYTMHYIKSQNLGLPVPTPGNTKEAYDYLVGLFDDIFRRSPETLELTLMKMRKGWSQQKYRQSSKAKKQVYFSLGKNAREQLDKLVQMEEKSKSDIIEALILGTKDQTT